jgi:hypothetical protein
VVLARQIWHSLGPSPTVSKRCQMFYMLDSVHHRVTTGETLLPPNLFWYNRPDLHFGVRSVAESFQAEPNRLRCSGDRCHLVVRLL